MVRLQVPKREKQYIREEDAEWYDDMMEKRLGSTSEFGVGELSFKFKCIQMFQIDQLEAISWLHGEIHEGRQIDE